MRVRMQQIIHLNRSRYQLRKQVRQAPEDAELQEKLEDHTDRLINLMVEELTDQSRDVTSAMSAARRPRFAGGY